MTAMMKAFERKAKLESVIDPEAGGVDASLMSILAKERDEREQGRKDWQSLRLQSEFLREAILVVAYAIEVDVETAARDYQTMVASVYQTLSRDV